MPSQEERFRVIWEFVKQGDPAAVQADIQRLQQSAQQATQAVQQSGQAAQQAATHHQQLGQRAQESASALRVAGDAAYHFGMGAMWAELPATRFLVISGNLIQGLDWMARGFQEITSRLTPAVTALVLATVAVTGLGVALAASARAAEEMTERVVKLAEVSGQSLGRTAQMVNTFATLFGPEGAGGAVEAIAQAQARTGLIGMFQQLAAAGMAQRAGGPGRFFAPHLQDPFAQFGISLFAPGSTPQRPIYRPQDEVLFQVARDIAARQDESLRAVQIARLGPLVGGTDVLGRLVREIERGTEHGETPEQVFGRLRSRGAFGFVPTEQDVQNLDRFRDATNALALAFGTLKAEVGAGLLPIFAAFLEGLTDFVRWVRDGVAWVREFTGGLGPLGPLLQELARTIGRLLVPAVLLLATVLVAALLPALGSVLAAAAPFIGIFLAIAAVLGAVTLAANLLNPVAKALWSNFLALPGAWKEMDLPGMGQQAKSWGDLLTEIFRRVGIAKDELMTNLRTRFPALNDIFVRVRWVVDELRLPAIPNLVSILVTWLVQPLRLPPLPNLILIPVVFQPEGLDLLFPLLAQLQMQLLALPAVVQTQVQLAVVSIVQLLLQIPAQGASAMAMLVGQMETGVQAMLGIWTQFTSTVQGQLQAILGTVLGLGQQVLTTWQSILQTIEQVIGEVSERVGGLIDGIRQRVEALIQTIQGISVPPLPQPGQGGGVLVPPVVVPAPGPGVAPGFPGFPGLPGGPGDGDRDRDFEKSPFGGGFGSFFGGGYIPSDILGLGFSNEVNAAILQASAATGLPWQLIAAVVKQESGGNPRAVSPAGAMGLMQLMPGTAAGLGVTNPFDPMANALGGAQYLQQQLQRFGSLDLALAAYNAGPGNVMRFGGIPPFEETQRYVRNVLALFEELRGSANLTFGEEGVLPQSLLVSQRALGTMAGVATGQLAPALSEAQAAAALSRQSFDLLAGVATGALSPAMAQAQAAAVLMTASMQQNAALVGGPAAQAMYAAQLAALTLGGPAGLLIARDSTTQLTFVTAQLKDLLPELTARLVLYTEVVRGIVPAARAAMAAVQDLINALNAIPRYIETVHVTVQRTVGQGGGGGGGGHTAGALRWAQESGRPVSEFYSQPQETQSLFNRTWGFQLGGIVTAPMFATVGEVPEAIIPLHRMADVLRDLDIGVGRGGGATTVVSVQVDGMDFSDPYQVERIAQKIGDHIVNNIRVMTRLGRTV